MQASQRNWCSFSANAAGLSLQPPEVRLNPSLAGLSGGQQMDDGHEMTVSKFKVLLEPCNDFARFYQALFGGQLTKILWSLVVLCLDVIEIGLKRHFVLLPAASYLRCY